MNPINEVLDDWFLVANKRSRTLWVIRKVKQPLLLNVRVTIHRESFEFIHEGWVV